ncbi:MAG: hypothetical protein JWN34_2148 [Bryobacterales bacterium]|nr:hypothetical protein [Bryobacterales bacterium]
MNPISPALARARAALLASWMQPTSAQNIWDMRKVIIACLLPASTLRARLMRCGTRSGNNYKRFDCNSPACPVCAQRKASRFSYQRSHFSPPKPSPFVYGSRRHVPKVTWAWSLADCCWATIITNLHTDIPLGAAENRRQQRALKHVIRGLTGPNFIITVQAARDIEVIEPADLNLLSPTKQALLMSLGFPVNHAGPVYVFHWHLLVDLNGIHIDTFKAALRARWGLGNRQVHVIPVSKRSHVPRLTVYQTKVRMTKEPAVGGRRQWLPPHIVRDLAEGLHSLGPRWRRFSVRL